MTDYLQPDFYRFSEDSLKLVEKVRQRVKKAERILDLGAGCGVIGIELAISFLPRSLTLVELQKEYEEFLVKNLELLLPPAIVESKIEICSFSTWKSSGTYDLIVCNPPYYLPGHGQKNKDERRGNARSFLVDDWKILLEKIQVALSQEGKCFLVIKNDQRIVDEIKRHQGLLRSEFSSEGDLFFIELSRLHEDRGHELP
ncbi:MAG: methyltransferase [Bacteriovoracia bacterium]